MQSLVFLLQCFYKMLHIRVGILAVVLMVQYEVATSITSVLHNKSRKSCKSSSLPNFEREHLIYKEQIHPIDTTISVQNPTASFKINTPVKRHAGAGSSAYNGWLKWKAYKKRRNRNRTPHHRHASKPYRSYERTTRNNHHQYRDRPKKVFFQDEDYPRRNLKKQYYQKEKPQNIRIQSLPSKHAFKYVDRPSPMKKQRTVTKIHKPWKKLIPWVTSRPGMIPDEFSLEEPLPELGGSPPSYPTKPGFPNNYRNIDQNVPYKYESYKNPISIPDSAAYNSYALDLNSLKDENFLNNYLKQSSSEFGSFDLSASDVIPYNKYSPIVENMRDYNWYDYNKHIYSISTEPSLANAITEYKQYETIPVTEYYQQNYNTPEPVSVLKEPISSIKDLAIAYSDIVPDVVKLEENLKRHEHMPITEYKQQNHSQLFESVLQEPINITKSSSLNLKVISAHQMDEKLQNKDKEMVENIFPPFKKESRFSSKRNVTKYLKPFHRIDNENNSSVYNGHTYNIHSPKGLKSSEDLGENFVTITPDKNRRDDDVPDRVYDTTTRDTDLRRNQDAMNQKNALRRRRIVKKESVRKTDQDIKEAILTNILFVDDNI